MQFNQKIQLTPEGILELQKELDELVKVKRPALVARLSNAREQGDLSENTDYISAKEELSFMDDRIMELQAILDTASVVKKAKTGVAGIGSKVTLQKVGKKTTYTYSIVGDWEANPQEQKISVASPLGMAIEGKKAGDKASVKAPAGMVEYEIVSID